LAYMDVGHAGNAGAITSGPMDVGHAGNAGAITSGPMDVGHAGRYLLLQYLHFLHPCRSVMQEAGDLL
jgi:hypothetical protein